MDGSVQLVAFKAGGLKVLPLLGWFPDKVD